MIYKFTERKRQSDWLEDELQSLKKEYEKLQMSKEQYEKLQDKMKEASMENKKNKTSNLIKYTAAAALVVGFMALPNTSATVANAMGKIPVIGSFVNAVTFRDYKYESDKNNADIKVPELKIGEELKDSEKLNKLQHTTDNINSEIQKITDELLQEFEKNLDEEGYQDISVDSEVLAATEEYFTLKLRCYQGAGSGYQFNYFYTIDLNTGERLQLKDIFKDGTDYITPISKNIKKQMKERMVDDENAIYWIDNEIKEWNFKKITDKTLFYLDKDGQIVISFNEGEVAPMYMGVVEFVIPEEELEGVRK